MRSIEFANSGPLLDQSFALNRFCRLRSSRPDGLGFQFRPLALHLPSICEASRPSPVESLLSLRSERVRQSTAIPGRLCAFPRSRLVSKAIRHWQWLPPRKPTPTPYTTFPLLSNLNHAKP